MRMVETRRQGIRTGRGGSAIETSTRRPGWASYLRATMVSEIVFSGFFLSLILSMLLSAAAMAQDQPSADAHPATGNVATASNPEAPDGWHVLLFPYLWFPGAHGETVTLGQDVGIHSSASDLLSETRFGIMGTLDPRYKRWVLPVDLFWVRLEDTKALTFPPSTAVSADFKSSEIMLTPRVGYRVIDQERLKIDGTAGFRYWHLGESVQLTPSIPGLNFAGSQNWVDPVIGGRIETFVTPKVGFFVSGDVGGWGVGSQLDYQMAALVGYRIKPKMTLAAGFRYTAVNYRNGPFIYDIVSSGILVGVRVQLK